MVMLIDADVSSGIGILVLAFAVVAAYLFVMTGGLTLLLGLAIVGVALTILYYVGVRVHRAFAGKRRRSS